MRGTPAPDRRLRENQSGKRQSVIVARERGGQTDWPERAKALLKAELKRRSVSYRELAERLTKAGSPESERNLTNKISRGGFTAAFLLQCLDVIDCQTLRLKD